MSLKYKTKRPRAAQSVGSQPADIVTPFRVLFRVKHQNYPATLKVS